MNTKVLRRWSDPKVILVITSLFDEQTLMFHAIRQARKSSAKILLVHVPRPAYLSVNPGEGLSSVLPGSSAHGVQVVLDRLVRKFRWEGISCESVHLNGLPEEKIPSLVKSHGVDRVIVSTHGDRRIERLSTESTAEGLFPALQVPVCVIGKRVPIDTFGDRPSGRISLALSLQGDSGMHLNFACRFAQENQAHLTVLHVFNTKCKRIPVDVRTPIAVAARLPAPALTEASLFCPLEIAVREGDPAREILKFDSCTNQDFIILGSPEVPPNARLQNTSVVHRVVAEARCPVIVFRPPAATTRVSSPKLSDLESALYAGEWNPAYGSHLKGDADAMRKS